MIKKLLGFFTFCLGLVGISFGYGLQVFELGLEEDINDSPTQNNYFELQNNANFLLNGNYKLLQTYSKKTSGGTTINYARLRNIFRTENGLYAIVSVGTKTNGNVQTNQIKQGYIFQYCKTTYGETSNDICNTYTVNEQIYGISTFLNNPDYANPDILLYNDGNQVYNLCFGYESLNENICFNLDGSDANDYCNDTTTIINNPGFSRQCDSLDFTYNPLSSELGTNSDQISSYFSNSPFQSSGGGGEDEGDYNFHDLSNDAIRYFENMGFRKSMCYVGTNDLTTNYGSGSVSFQSGTGKTIFDLFESIYIDIDETDLGLQAVSNWLNSWLGNYDKRFSTNGQPGYRLFYSSVDELIHVYYYLDGDTPVFQFLNNPYSIYFMASNISTYTQYKSMFDYEGDEVVDYCNLKLNGGTFQDMISNPIKDSVVNSSSNNIGGNNFGSGSWSGGSGSFIGGGGTGGTGGTSGLDIIDYTGTWSDLQFSGDVDLKSFFDNALEEMKGAIDNMQNPLTGVLPNYIIFALLLVVLFKILRH